MYSTVLLRGQRVVYAGFKHGSRFSWGVCNIAKNFVMSFRPSAWKNSATTGRIFMEISYLKFFEYLSRIHSVFCLTTGPKPPPKRFLHIVRSRASSFKWEYPLLSLRSSSSFLHLLPRLLVTSISPFIFPSITFWYNDQKCRSLFTPHCDQMISLITYRASPQGQKVTFISTACFLWSFHLP